MTFLTNLAPVLAAVVSIILILAILLQKSGSGIGSGLGGSSFAQVNYTRRGFEKFLFYTTIILAILLTAFVLATSILK